MNFLSRNFSFLSLVVLFIPLNIFSQDPDRHVLDSLRNVIDRSENDSVKISTLNALSIELYQSGAYDSALKYCNQAMKIAEQSDYRRGLAEALSNRGIISNEQGNYSLALSSHQSALLIYDQIGDRKSVANSYNYIANTYHLQGDFPNALKNQISALTIREKIGDKEGMAWSYNNIGIIYRIQGDNEAALKNYNESLKLLEALGDKKMMATAYNNIANIYLSNHNFSQSLKYYFISLKFRQDINDLRAISTSYNNIGDFFCDLYEQDSVLNNFATQLTVDLPEKGTVTFTRKHWLDTAFAYQIKAFEINKKLDDNYFSIFSLSGLGRVNFLHKNYKPSIGFYSRAYEYASNMKAVDLQKEIAKYLSDSYSKLNDYRNGMYWFQKYTEHKDSLFNEERTRDLTRSQMKYEFEKSQQIEKAQQDKKDALAKAELGRQKKMRNIFIGGFTLVLFFAGIFFYQRNNIRKEKIRSDELLLNILPSEIAGELKQTGSAKARRYEEVTVMFADFIDFTKVSEKIGPEKLVDEIHACFSAFDNILQKHKIEKIKTIGDAYLCAGGIPGADPAHARNVVRAAIEIRDFMLERKKLKDLKNEISFEIRMGIHTGPVVAGIVGVKKYAYDIWGDTVNIAARMEQNSLPGKINISSSTYSLIRNEFNCSYRGKIDAKNKGEIDMYFLET